MAGSHRTSTTGRFAWAGEREQRNVAGALDSALEKPLMLGAETGVTARQDLAAISDELA